MSPVVHDGAGPPELDASDLVIDTDGEPEDGGHVEARAGSSPSLGDAAGDPNPSARRLRSKVPVKIPDDTVPAQLAPMSTPTPPQVDLGPLALAPMRMISLSDASQPIEPLPARPSSQITPAPGTDTSSDPGWTPGPPAIQSFTPEERPRLFTPDLEEISADDIAPDSEEPKPYQHPIPPAPPQSLIPHSRPEHALPPPRPHAVTRPDGIAASQPPPRSIPAAAPIHDIALPPPRPPMASSPSDVITSAKSPYPSRPPPDLPPPRGPMPSRPPPDAGTSAPPPPPPPRMPSVSHPAITELVTPTATAQVEAATAQLRIEELPDGPRTMEVEDIYVSLNDTATEEPAGLVTKAATPPPPPPPKVSSPPPPVAEAKAAAPAPPAPVEAPASAREEKPRSMKEGAMSSKKRARPWWEEMFDDDFLRSLERPSDRLVIAESLFIEERLGLQKGAVVLDLACGAGRHAVELTRRGYKVVGYDLSLAMLARAQDEASDADQNINFLHGDMREMAFESMFDGVYCWGMSFGFFEEEKNVNVVQRIHKALRPGGVFLLDVCNRDFIAPRQPNLVWFEGEGCICMDETNLDFITSRLKVKRTVMIEEGRTRELDYSIRLYGLHELGKILHDNGFKVLEVSGQIATPGVFFGSESPRCLVLAERG